MIAHTLDEVHRYGTSHLSRDSYPESRTKTRESPEVCPGNSEPVSSKEACLEGRGAQATKVVALEKIVRDNSHRRIVGGRTPPLPAVDVSRFEVFVRESTLSYRTCETVYCIYPNNNSNSSESSGEGEAKARGVGADQGAGSR